MTTPDDRDATALLVVDVQRGVLAGAHDAERVVAAIVGLVDRARAADRPVVWVQHHDDDLPVDSDAWQLVDELRPTDDEATVHKRHRDAFDATDLPAVLAARAVGHVLVVGADTERCVRSTLHGALARGWHATLVADAHTTQRRQPGGVDPASVVAHANATWAGQAGHAARGGTTTAAEVVFGPAA